MCGRYSLYGAAGLDNRYKLDYKPQFVSQDSYNIAPRQRLPIIYMKDGKRVAELMQWGFVPFFTKDLAKAFRSINTVCETSFEKPMWRKAMQSQRCLVPARGFYEWDKVIGKGGVQQKVPYYIRPKDMEIFSFAGVYSIWKDVEGHPLYTFSILTTAANKQVSVLHNRMPVILTPEQEEVWLNPAYSEQEQLAELLVPYEEELEIYKVSEDVNSPRNNDKHLIEQVT